MKQNYEWHRIKYLHTHTHTHIYIYIYIYICALPVGRWTLWKRNMTVATCGIPISSNELTTSVSESVKCKQTEVIIYTLNSLVFVGSVAGWVMLSVWRVIRRVSIRGWSASHAHDDELWYNETVSGWQSIYIYIYIIYLE